MPSTKFLLLLSFLLLHCLFLHSLSSDLDDLEELLAIDDELEAAQATTSHPNPSDADILSKAQRIVTEITNENVNRVIGNSEFVMILGYTPWCARSADLMPKFAEAAMRLKELGSRVLMAKVDAESHGKAAEVLGIRGFPTLVLAVNGSLINYNGGYTGEEIVIWARKKTGDPVVRLSSITAAEEFLKRHQIYVIGLFEKYEGPEYKEFIKAATADSDIQFVETNDISIATVLFPRIGEKKHFLGLVKSEPERFEEFEGTFEEEKILQFIEYKKFALVTTLTEQNSARVYSSPMKIQVFIFAKADDLKHLLFPVQDVAKRYKTKIMFVFVDSAEDNLAKPFLTLFGLESENPIVTAFDNRKGFKYLLESDPTPSNIEEFCSGLLNGALSPYFKSEPKPDTVGMVEKVVGRTFDASVLNSIENVLLEVFTPWCMECESASKLVEKVARHFKQQENLKFARIDASLNEHPKLQVDNFPTLLFYPSRDKSNPIKLAKKSSLKEVTVFIKENLKLEEDRGVSSEDQLKDEL